MSADEPIATTRDRPGSYDAIATAKPGEPLFPIQGGDPFGPPTVLHWVALCRAAGIAETDPKKAEALLRKASDAERVAWAMMAYQRGEVEMPGTRSFYNDDGPAAARASDGRDERETLIKGSASLHNSLSIATEVASALAKLRVHPESEVKIREAVELLREAAFQIEPRRGNERS
ncbi:MAG: hypothetical protein ACJ8DZ_13890 [Allosphingosinicella sp.]